MEVKVARARAGRKSARLLRWRWGIVALLLVIGCVDYLDRSTLSIGNPLIRRDLHLSVVQMGWLLSAFSWSYAIFLIASGGIVDRWGARKVVALGSGLWSIAQLLAGVVANFPQFVVARVLLGTGESPFFPGGTRATADWFPPRDRPLAIGTWVSSSMLGPTLAAPVLTVLMLAIGWRGMFLSMGVAGLILAGVWAIAYRRPREAGLSEAELAEAAAGQGGEEGEHHGVSLRSWGRLFGHVPTWGLILGFFGYVYLQWIYLTWLPGYLELTRHVAIAATGALVTIPFAAGFLGYVCSGVLTHWFQRLGLSPVSSSKYCMVIGLVAMAVFTVPAPFTDNLGVAVACISLAQFFGGFPGAMCWTLSTSVAPRALVASLGSIQDFGGYIGGALAPALTGMIFAATGSFTPAFVLGAVLAVGSALAYLLLVRRPIPA